MKFLTAFMAILAIATPAIAKSLAAVNAKLGSVPNMFLTLANTPVALNGMTFGPHITHMYEELDRPRKIGHLMIAIDPDRFAGGADEL